jgi:hypothetical protein
MGSAGCQPVDLGSLPRSGNGFARELRSNDVADKGCRQPQAGSLCVPKYSDARAIQKPVTARVTFETAVLIIFT